MLQGLERFATSQQSLFMKVNNLALNIQDLSKVVLRSEGFVREDSIEGDKTLNDRDGRRKFGEDVTFGKPKVLLVFEGSSFGCDKEARLLTGRLSRTLMLEEDGTQTSDDRGERWTNDEAVICGKLVCFVLEDGSFADKTAEFSLGRLCKTSILDDGSFHECGEGLLDDDFEASV